MNVEALLAALPAAIVAALTSDPQGITSTDQVRVSDKREAYTSGNTAEAWVVAPDRELVTESEGVDHSLVSYRVDVRCSSPNGSADLESWADQLRDAFHGVCNPSSVANLVSCQVEEVLYDTTAGEEGASECRVGLRFCGWRTK